MSSIGWEHILESTAVITTVLQFLTGSLVCRKYVQKKSTGDSSGFPFVCGFLSCSLWLNYAKLTNEKSVALVNSIGSTLFFIYILLYYVITVNKSTLLKQFSTAALLLMSSILYVHLEQDHAVAVQVMGILCCTVTVIFFAAPLTMLLHVIRIKSTESLPFPLILSSFFVSLQWFIYGIMIDDTFIQLPNFLGCVLSGSQLLLFVMYSSKTNYNGPNYKLLDQANVF